MIVRVLAEGQFDVPDDALDELNALDDTLARAVDRGAQDEFERGLHALLEAVRERGERLPDDYLGPSDLVLPGGDASLDDVRALLGDEGLIPG